jgi:hypothetical protein
MRRPEAPDLDTGLPRALERRLARRYGRSAGRRVRLAAALRAIVVLVRRHPRAVLDMAGAGMVQASRTGVRELTARLGRYDRPAVARPRRPLTRRELRAFRRLLDREGDVRSG